MLSPSKLNDTDSLQDQYENPFADANDRAALIEPDLDLTGQSTTTASAPTQIPVTPVPVGNITNASSTRQPTENLNSNVYTGEDTLDEAVTVTIVKSKYMKRYPKCLALFKLAFFFVVT